MLTNTLLLLLVTSCCAEFTKSTSRKSNHHEKLVNYTVSLVEHLASQQISTFDCWLYHLSSDPPNSSSLLQDIHIQLDRKLIPRRSLDSRIRLSDDHLGWKQPSLVIVHVDVRRENFKALSNCGELLGLLDRDTLVLVLMSFRSSWVFVYTFLPSLTVGKHLNMVFLSVDKEEMVFPEVLQRRFIKFNMFWKVERMFLDQSRYLHGVPLRYSVNNGFLNSCIGSNCEGYDVSIVKETAKYLNTTAQMVPFKCRYEYDKKVDTESNCVYEVTYWNDCPFDFIADPVTSSRCIRHYLVKPFPQHNVFLAPRGRALNIAELFLRPFQKELWILFFVGMLAVKLISILMPNSFRNDPILLPICGFERYSLNQTDRKEKLLMLSLIVLFFFASNAYETKIISLMSSKPRVASVSTLQDILNNQIPVRAEWFLAAEFPTFESLYIYHSELPSQLDGTSVYLMIEIVGSLLLQRKTNWDYESNQPRYKILDEKLAMVVGFYPLPLRSALKPHFRFVQRALFESGILDRWISKWSALGSLKYADATLPEGVNPNSVILKFSDLMPAWLVVLVGTIIGTGVFALEVFGIALQRKVVLVAVLHKFLNK